MFSRYSLMASISRPLSLKPAHLGQPLAAGRQRPVGDGARVAGVQGTGPPAATAPPASSQVAALTGGAVAAGGPVPYAGNPIQPAGRRCVAGGGAQLKESGKLIEAIKVYREHTGLGLKEAKDAVEGMA